MKKRIDCIVSRFSHVGSIFSHVGSIFSHVGSIFSHVGSIFSQVVKVIAEQTNRKQDLRSVDGEDLNSLDPDKKQSLSD